MNDMEHDLKTMKQIPAENITFDRFVRDVLERGGPLMATVVDEHGISRHIVIDENQMTVNGQPLSQFLQTRDETKSGE